MAKTNYDDEDGVWRTIGGRRIFIKEGQDLASAMKESGKFTKGDKKGTVKSKNPVNDLKDKARELDKEPEFLKNATDEEKENYYKNVAEIEKMKKMGQNEYLSEKARNTAKEDGKGMYYELKNKDSEQREFARSLEKEWKDGGSLKEMYENHKNEAQKLGFTEEEFKNELKSINESETWGEKWFDNKDKEWGKESTKDENKRPEPWSKEDYEERDRRLQKRVDEGLISKEDAEYEKLKQAWTRDEITREEFDKRREELYSKKDQEEKYSTDGKKISESDIKAEYDKEKARGNIDKEISELKDRNTAKEIVANKLGIDKKDVSLLVKADGTIDIKDNIEYNKSEKDYLSNKNDPYYDKLSDEQKKIVDEAKRKGIEAYKSDLEQAKLEYEKAQREYDESRLAKESTNETDFNKYISENYGTVDALYEMRTGEKANSVTDRSLRNNEEWQKIAKEVYNDRNKGETHKLSERTQNETITRKSKADRVAERLGLKKDSSTPTEKSTADSDRDKFKQIAKFYGYDKMDNDAIKRTLDDAEKKGMYHSKDDIDAMRRYLDRTVVEKDTGSAYSKPGKRWEVLEESKSAYGKDIYKVRDEEGNVQWKDASTFYPKEKASDIEKMVKKGNTYIPVRKGETEKQAIDNYAKTEEPQTEKADSSARRQKLVNYVQENKDQIRKWVDEYDDKTNKQASEKAKQGKGLTAKEYFGFLGGDVREGGIVNQGDKEMYVGKNGKLTKIPDSHYKTLPNGDRYHVGKEGTDEYYENVMSKYEGEFEPKESNSAYKKAFTEYKKNHPNTKLTLKKFIDISEGR